MKTYATSYPSGVYHYASYVRASSLTVAEKRLKERGIGEKIDGRVRVPKRISAYDLYAKKKYAECIHWLCFAGNVLCNAGLWRREQLLDDSGLIHMIIHRMTTGKRTRKRYASFFDCEHSTTLVLLKVFDERAARVGY